MKKKTRQAKPRVPHLVHLNVIPLTDARYNTAPPLVLEYLKDMMETFGVENHEYIKGVIITGLGYMPHLINREHAIKTFEKRQREAARAHKIYTRLKKNQANAKKKRVKK